MERLVEIISFFEKYIPKDGKGVYKGSWGLENVQDLAKFLGHPQEKYQVVHIAGTSGKGSVAYLTSTSLKSLGLKVGLHTSPFILDFREAFVINNQLIDVDKLWLYFEEYKLKVLEFTSKKKVSMTYYELLACFSYYIFFKEKVDVAVVEVGVGGLYDCTNIIQNPNKVAVITKLGFDHTEILGQTILEIASQKCGIIKPLNTVITLKQDYLEADRTIHNFATINNSKLITINKHVDFLLKNQSNKFFYTGKFLKEEFNLKLKGKFQLENASLALAAFEETFAKLKIKNAKLKINQKLLYNSLYNLQIPGRMDIKKVKNSLVVLDGAHNPQKMENLIMNLKASLPTKKFRFLVSFLDGKKYSAMLDLITPLAGEIVYSSFQVRTQALNKSSVEFSKIKNYFETKNFKNFLYFKNNKEAMQYFLKINKIQDNEILVITGSLYFLAEIYKLEPFVDK